jgi:Putative bacterial sensory transduction regulator
MSSEQATENGTRAVETLRTFLTKMELDPQEETFPGVVAFRMQIEGPTPKTVARILVPKERFTVHFFFGREAPPERRAQVAEFVTRINWGLVDGNFEFSLGSGVTRFKTGLDFTGVPLTRELIRNAMQSAMEIIETFVEPLWDVIDGDAEPEAAEAAVRARLPAD